MWIKRGTQLITLLALLVLVAGLLVLALPESEEGAELVQLDAAHSLRTADLIGTAMIVSGACLIWIMALAWQRKYIH